MSSELRSEVQPGPGAIRTQIQTQQQAARRPPDEQTSRSPVGGSQYFTGPMTSDPEPYSNNMADMTPEHAWNIYGGGIRGYWSLLALQKLMVWIAHCEQAFDTNVKSSFHPEPWQESVSQVPLEAGEESESTGIAHIESGGAGETSGPKASRRYLPCHYFDYIGGSSTGSLIAIMLGRLRMTVLDCIDEYKRLGHRVFGTPRLLWPVTVPFTNRTKYDSKEVERVFEDVVGRRGEQDSYVSTFKSKTHICNTFVTTLAKKPKETSKSLYIIRSYDLADTSHSTQVSRQNTAMSNNERPDKLRDVSGRYINRGPAHDFEVWKVARAATAAPFYFDPVEIPSAEICFTDGGFGQTNNPTREGINEVMEAEPMKELGCVVSVGTARHPQAQHREKRFIAHKMRSMLLDITDPDIIHKEVQRQSQRQRFPYYRLNPHLPEHLLTMGLDDWSPKFSLFGRKPGSDTIEKIEQTFKAWYSDSNAETYFQECARQLVQIRRKRSEYDRFWPRFALAAEYKCRGGGGCRRHGTGFSDPVEFRKHLAETHGLGGDKLEREIPKCRHIFKYSVRRNSSRQSKVRP